MSVSVSGGEIGERGYLLFTTEIPVSLHVISAFVCMSVLLFLCVYSMHVWWGADSAGEMLENILLQWIGSKQRKH